MALRPTKYTTEELTMIQSMYLGGWSYGNIGKTFSITRNAVAGIISRRKFTRQGKKYKLSTTDPRRHFYRPL